MQHPISLQDIWSSNPYKALNLFGNYNARDQCTTSLQDHQKTSATKYSARNQHTASLQDLPSGSPTYEALNLFA